MEDQILKEIKAIRHLLSEMLGTADLPAKEKFSKEAVAKVAIEFRKMAIARGEWLSSDDIDKVIKNAPWRAGKVIMEKFGFTNCFKQGHTWYFNKKDLIELNKELKERNINLKQYIELLEDQAKFEKLVNSINLPKKSKTRKHFKIPEGLRDITSKPYTVAEEPISKEIETLLEDYKKFDLSEYIDLYEKKTYAMFKYDYHLDRYLKPELKKYCRDWCFKYNYANDAFKRIKEIKAQEFGLKGGC